MSCLTNTLCAYPTMVKHLLRRSLPPIGLFALFCALTVATAGFSGNAQSPTPAAEPQTVGPVTNLTASVAGQADGSVRLTWSQAENAQVHFVVYAKSDEVNVGNYANARMAPFSATEGVITGLEGGTSYSFIVIGMRWNWVNYGAVWGTWSQWADATPAGSVTVPQPAAQAAEPDTVGQVANLTASTDGQDDGAVRLTWSQAQDAQVHFVVYAKSDEVNAGNYTNAQIAPFAGTEGMISGLDGGTSYSFIGIGMRWNWVDYGAVWGTWSGWQAATPVACTATGTSAERAALTALYNATGGPNWTDNTKWLTDVPICQWYGVVTNDSGRVTELNLDKNGLTGQIPPELEDLENLTTLYLHLNNLTGNLPASLGNLSNLEVLSLGGNQFTGMIPSAWSNLSNLRELYLRESNLMGTVPSWLGNLTSLEVLNLGGNQFAPGPMPSTLTNLSNLSELHLWECQLDRDHTP